MERRDFLKKTGESILYSFFVAEGLSGLGKNNVVHAQEKPYWPIYELTEKQRNFIKGSKVNEYLWEYRDLFFENAENIRKGKLSEKLSGSPLECMLKIMSEKGLFPQPADITQLSLEYNISKDGIVNAYAIYGLEIIDGKPKIHPTQEGLIFLRNTGLLDYINNNWGWFDEKKKEELRVERQSGKIFGETMTGRIIILGLLGQYRPETTLGRYLIKQEEEKGINPPSKLLPLLGAGTSFVDNKLFEEIPQKYKVVKHPKYTELENPKLETKK